MRIRTIKPSFFISEEITELSPYARLLFIGLWLASDRRGRLEDRPRRLKAEIFPYDDIDMEALLDELLEHKFITRYEVNGLNLIWVNNFEKHQICHKTEKESIFPEFNESHTVKEPLSNGSCRDFTRGKGREGKGKEGKGKERKGSTDCSEQKPPCSKPAAPPPDMVLEFPCSGKIQTWHLTQSQVNQWIENFPAVDVMSECRKALAWSNANPKRRKTATRFASWLVTVWLSKAQDSARNGRMEQKPRYGRDQLDTFSAEKDADMADWGEKHVPRKVKNV